jgi:small subunit ribosomal protein S13
MVVRLAGINLPQEKRIPFALTAIHGIGRKRAATITAQAKIAPLTKVKDLKETEVARLRELLGGVLLEGDLRRQIQQNIRHLQEIGAYRGMRHRLKLPARGQRTRTNARTKRGKRVTMGSGRIKLQKT